MEKVENYDELFKRFEKYCIMTNTPNVFSCITFRELEELNNLLDKLTLFRENHTEDYFEEIEAEDILRLSNLVEELFDRSMIAED